MKLQIVDVNKSYKSGEKNGVTVRALNHVSLNFREHEFVTILGPSGCGKTTLLNIIGGLDRSDSGELILGGLSTQSFTQTDLDAYRNRSIGFVFQNYNLIGHQSVLSNVEISLTLSGVSKSVRKLRAMDALNSVGLSDQAHKKPNQLSGGQMQRVAIARALINNPDILLADEPTGALDSQTSLQLMDILTDIAKSRLVIMVTHNTHLAERYSTRIIQMLDGAVTLDSDPLLMGEDDIKVTSLHARKPTRTAMSMRTAISLSLHNLLTKKGRTLITAFAGSIGIIGVALVLALASGLTDYMNTMQLDTLSGYPLTVSTSMDMMPLMPNPEERVNAIAGHIKDDQPTYTEFPDQDVLYSHKRAERNTAKQHTNVFTEEYLAYIAALPSALPDSATAISYTRSVTANLLAKGGEMVVKFDTSSQIGGMGGFGGLFARGGMGAYWQEMPDNQILILGQYDLIGKNSAMPTAANEILLVVDEYNRLDAAFFAKIGMDPETHTFSLNDFIGRSFLKLIPNDDYYSQTSSGRFVSAPAAQYDALYTSDDGLPLTVVGILRPKNSAMGGMLSPGIAYTTMLTDTIANSAFNSRIAIGQAQTDSDVTTGMRFVSDAAYKKALNSLGVITTPTSISIYPTSFTAKDAIKQYLNAYNVEREPVEQVLFSDLAEMITSATATMLNTVSAVLIGFAAIALMVSTIMIGIITYVSVIERTKDIGILRSVGARKKDISRVFNAETLLVGCVAGALGVTISYALSLPINAMIVSMTGISNIASLRLTHAALLIGGSMILTLIAGLIPAKIAAGKDPVVALRTE